MTTDHSEVTDVFSDMPALTSSPPLPPLGPGSLEFLDRTRIEYGPATSPPRRPLPSPPRDQPVPPAPPTTPRILFRPPPREEHVAITIRDSPKEEAEELTDEDFDLCIAEYIHALNCLIPRIESLYFLSRDRGVLYTNTHLHHLSREVTLSAAILHAEMRALLCDLDKHFDPEMAHQRESFEGMMHSLQDMRTTGFMPLVWDQVDKLDDMGLLFAGIKTTLEQVLKHKMTKKGRRVEEEVVDR